MMKKNNSIITTILAIMTATTLTTGLAVASTTLNANTTRDSSARQDSHRATQEHARTTKALNAATATVHPTLTRDAHSATVVANERDRRPQRPTQRFTCKNSLARILHTAGFKGASNRIAWAIVMRESHGKNLDENSPYFSGALGIFQIQTSAHSNKPWWSRNAMLHPATQTTLVYRHMTEHGTHWQAWGIDAKAYLSGNSKMPTLDTTNYRGWSSWQHQNWIWNPFQRNFLNYPC